MMYRQLGRSGLKVSAIGLGCMGMSQSYGTPDAGESIRTLHRALDLGLTALRRSTACAVHSTIPPGAQRCEPSFRALRSALFDYVWPSGVGPRVAEPAFLQCGPFNKDIRPREMGFYDEGNTERLNFTVDPESGADLPAREQWIEITGAFDHPASQQCGPDAGIILGCRAVFVVTDISASE
jgi:hypothetical protein